MQVTAEELQDEIDTLAVRDELRSAGAPEAIARFMAAAPAWLEIGPIKMRESE